MQRRKAKRKEEKKAQSDASSSSTSSSSAILTPDALSLKELGNRAYVNNEYPTAIHYFTLALQQDPQNAILYSNRSASYNANLQFPQALADADQAIRFAPSWSKGYLRRGQALEHMMQLKAASEAFASARQHGADEPETQAFCDRSLNEIQQLMEDMRLSSSEMSGRDNPEDDKFTAMINWLREGNAQFPYLYLQYYDEDYRGVHAITKVPNNKIVLEVPLSHIMTSDVAKASDVGQKIIKSGCELNSTHSFLAAYLLQEKNNPHSFWRPYIRILPQHYKNMPIFFAGSDLDLLKGSFSLRKIVDRQEELKEEYENICRHVAEFRNYELEEFIWARLVVITRIFCLMVHNNKTDGLVPMADMLNHKRPRETSWTYDDSRESFTITTLRPINRGEQIFDSYGRKCNSRFFVNYGFSLEENDDNQVAIWLGLPPDDPHYTMKCRILGSIKAGAQWQRFQIPIDCRDANTKQCFSFLRFVHARDSELLMLSEKDEIDPKKIEPLSIRNELEVVKHLARVCAACMNEFPNTIEEDIDLLAEKSRKLTMNERNAILMRRGEKDVLQYYIDLEKQVNKLVSMPWKDVKRQAAKAHSGQGRFDTYITTIVVPLLKNG